MTDSNKTYPFTTATYTGSGTGTQNIGHGLGATPDLVWTKTAAHDEELRQQLDDLQGLIDYLAKHDSRIGDLVVAYKTMKRINAGGGDGD